MAKITSQKVNIDDVPLVGREDEIVKLHELLYTKEAEMVAIYGRRRVGKSFLIKKAYKKETIFSLIGTKDASKADQLENFIDNIKELSKSKIPLQKPKSWKAAFKILRTFIEDHKSKYKKVIFFDELPWLASPKSGFLQALEYFWNSWAVDQTIILVICGSAPSWMMDNIINDTGGLHNRVTKKIHLQPFTLTETEKYFKSRKLKYNRYEIVQLYMVFGGVPFYLREIKANDSVANEIDRICFGEKAPLYGEFDNLYKALFTRYENYIVAIKALAKKKKGITRNELVTATKLSSGGTLTRILLDLEASSFITSYKPFGKKERETLYRLTDEYSFFHLSHIEKNSKTKGAWQKQVGSAAYNTWGGYGFESVCLKHVATIKSSLNIGGIYTEESSFYFHGNEDVPSFQIDLIIDRQDGIINICEMKFYKHNFIITKKYADQILSNLAYFKEISATKKRLNYTLITTYGLSKGQYNSVVDQSLTLDHLFV
jgi:uncharacterized protein